MVVVSVVPGKSRTADERIGSGAQRIPQEIDIAVIAAVEPRFFALKRKITAMVLDIIEGLVLPIGVEDIPVIHRSATAPDRHEAGVPDLVIVGPNFRGVVIR